VPDFIVAREASTSADCGTGFRDRQAPLSDDRSEERARRLARHGAWLGLHLRGIVRKESAPY
jgi:hypothetical protein